MKILALMAVLAAAQPGRESVEAAGWELVVDGVVRLERRPEAGFELPRLRATMEVDAPISVVGTILQEPELHKKWMHNTRVSELLDRQGSVFRVYHRLRSPPPVKSRDVVLEIRRTDSPGECRLEFQSIEWPGKPPVTGVVRMPQLSGFFHLRALPGGRTRVTYEFLADPGGSLPGFMAERGMRDMPLKTLENLRTRALARVSGTGK